MNFREMARQALGQETSITFVSDLDSGNQVKFGILFAKLLYAAKMYVHANYF